MPSRNTRSARSNPAACSVVAGQITRISGAENEAAAARTASSQLPRMFLRPLRSAGAQPILESHQRHVEAAAIASKDARRIQQLLINLAVTGEADFVVESQFRNPESQGGLNGFGGECSADGDRAIVVRHQIPLCLNWVTRSQGRYDETCLIQPAATRSARSARRSTVWTSRSSRSWASAPGM